MTTITAEMVKDLRDKTGAGMMDCKRALVESGGDMEKAVDHLRKAGIAKAAKKSGRTTTEGVIAAFVADGVAVLAEVACETDFVARNERFQGFIKDMLARTAANFQGQDSDITDAVAKAENETMTGLIATIGENMQIRRVIRWQSSGKFGYYLHMGGKIGVMIDVSGKADDELLSNICMHIAAFRPQYITDADVSENVLAKEREIAAAQIKDKPADMVAKIVEGKIRKWFSETCLVKQPWIRDDKTSLEKVAPGMTVRRFVRWEVGGELS